MGSISSTTLSIVATATAAAKTLLTAITTPAAHVEQDKVTTSPPTAVPTHEKTHIADGYPNARDRAAVFLLVFSVLSIIVFGLMWYNGDIDLRLNLDFERGRLIRHHRAQARREREHRAQLHARVRQYGPGYVTMLRRRGVI